MHREVINEMLAIVYRQQNCQPIKAPNRVQNIQGVKKLTAKGHNDRTPVQPDVRMPDKVRVNPDLVIRDITYPKVSPTPSDFRMVDRVIAMVRARARQAIAERVLGYKPVLMLPALGQASEMCYSYHSLKVR